MSRHAWLRPPRSLLVILFLLTVVSISAVATFGWRLLSQESVIEQQRIQERLERSADRIAVTVRGLLADTGERLSEGTPEIGPVFLLTDRTLSVMPPAALLYRPFPSSNPEAPAGVFAEGELLEFQQGQPASAVDCYRRLAASPDPAVRAGALARLARVLRRLGRSGESRAAYQQLAEIAGVQVAGEPADLVGLLALGEPLRDDLLRGRWPLTRGQFSFYWSKAVPSEAAPAMSPDLERAAAIAWKERSREPSPRGQATVWVDERPLFLMWRVRQGARAMLVAPPESFLKQSLAGDEAVFAAVDGEGRVVAGRKEGIGRAVVRTAAETQLPWALYVTRASGFRDADTIARRRFLLFGMTLMMMFMAAGSYFVARAIHRENAVSRLQSDFVSAVSHEFRSPLTSMRQLSEILVLGRVPSEERRQRYYETLVKETERLQRLVEKLLNFGGMEAGKRRYHFEPVDAAPLVEHVAREFEPQIAGSGRLIELHGQSSGCRITADREALSIALRNLVENALKYSPNSSTVWVEWERENGSVAIRVRDHGVGIPASERKAIFHKFVRGSAAASGGVKGTGVGLAMVYHIVTAHGGEIGVKSEPGQGSTFTITLPALRDV